MKRYPRYLALAVVALLPLYYFRFNVAGVPTNFIEVLVALLFVLTLVAYRRISFRYAWPIGLILVGVVLASYLALDKQTAFGIVKGWFVVPVVYYYCVETIFLPNERSLFVRPALVSLILVSAYVLLQRFGLIPLLAHQLPEATQYVDQGRAIGFFESPNFLAMFLVPLTLFVGGYLVLTKSYRACWWLILPLSAILLSQSRAGVLAIAAGIIWLLLLVRDSSPSRQGRPWPLVVLTALAAVLLVMWRSADDQQRLFIWQKAWELIKTHSIFGIGPGQFQANFAQLNDQSSLFAAALPYALHPHNLFLNYYLSAGLLGLVGFVWLLVDVGRELFQNPSRFPLVLAASAGLVAVIVHGLFDSTYFKNDLAITFWLLVFLMSNSYKESNEHRA